MTGLGTPVQWGAAGEGRTECCPVRNRADRIARSLGHHDTDGGLTTPKAMGLTAKQGTIGIRSIWDHCGKSLKSRPLAAIGKRHLVGFTLASLQRRVGIQHRLRNVLKWPTRPTPAPL